MPKGDTIPVKVPLVREPWGILKTLAVGRRNVLELIPEVATRQPIVSGVTGKRWHMVMDPVALRRVLRDRLDDYPKSVVTKNILGPAIGDSLFIAEGAHWMWQRRAAAPVFSRRNIDALAPIMTAAAEAACARLAERNGLPADMFDEMVTATFDVIADVTLSGDPAFDRDAVHRAIGTYIDAAARVSLFDIIGLPGWIPRPGRLGGPRAIRQMKRLADAAIERRRAAGARPVPDLLDLLLAGEDPETGRRMNTAELRDNLLTFIVAGHETTALALGWSLYLLGEDLQVQARLRAEANHVLQGRAATAADVPRLTYTRAVIEEALRLYPPAAFLSRTAMAPDRLCDRDIRRGDTVILPVYALHRNRLLWADPDAFRPDRFTPGHKTDRFAYLPFGDGPRICIGAQFAMTEAVIMLATLVSRFRFRLADERRPKPVLILTLRPEGGVWMTAEAINDEPLAA